MKKNYLVLLSAAYLLLVSACSTNRLAMQNDVNDDVYYTEAKAKELPEYVAKATPAKTDRDYRTDEQLYGDRYNNYDYYDGSYTSRLNRFYYNSPWRSYYDNWYNYSYSPWNNRYGYGYGPGVSLYIGSGPAWGYDPFMGYRYDPYWGYAYGYSPYSYGSRYWGPYSYNNNFPGYNYGGIYNNGGNVYNPNARTRPGRESVNRGGNSIYNYPNSSNPGTTNGRPQRSGVTPTDKPSSGRISSQPDQRGNTSSRPARESVQPQQRPEPAPRPERTYSPPPSQPAPSSPAPSSGGSGSSSSGNSRPSRD